MHRCRELRKMQSDALRKHVAAQIACDGCDYERSLENGWQRGEPSRA